MMFSTDPKFENPIDDLDKDSLINWNRIPAHTRECCIALLRAKTPPEMMNHWKDQYDRKIRIGSDDPWFHIMVGMQIRNALRSILKDDELPFVKYPDGSEVQNWDDFYGGALQQLVATSEDILFSPIGGLK